MRDRLWVLMVLLLASCALPERRFVDEDGLPLEGVLVMSSFPGDMLFGGASATACLTNADGFAPVASRDNIIAIKPGYHTWTQWGHDDGGRSTMAAQRHAAVMHRRTGRDQPDVHIFWQEMRFVTREDEVQSVPLPSEMGVTLELVDRTDFRARAQEGQLVQSRRFYFSGPSESDWATSLNRADDLSFYVQTPTGRTFKVGVTRAHAGKGTRRMEVDGVVRHVPAEMVTVLWAELGGQVRTVEPPGLEHAPDLHLRPVRVPWFDDSSKLVFGDASTVAAALRLAVDRGDVVHGDDVGRWLARLDEAAAGASVGP